MLYIFPANNILLLKSNNAIVSVHTRSNLIFVANSIHWLAVHSITCLVFNLYYTKTISLAWFKTPVHIWAVLHPRLIIFQRSQRLYYICNRIMDIVKRKFLFSCLLTGCMSCDTSPQFEKHTAQAFLYGILIPHPINKISCGITEKV